MRPPRGRRSACYTSARAALAATGTVQAHTHSCTELFYCLSGEGQFFIDGKYYPVHPDDMVIVNPQVEHTELSLNSSPLEYVVLGISGIEIVFGQGGCSVCAVQL